MIQLRKKTNAIAPAVWLLIPGHFGEETFSNSMNRILSIVKDFLLLIVVLFAVTSMCNAQGLNPQNACRAYAISTKVTLNLNTGYPVTPFIDLSSRTARPAVYIVAMAVDSFISGGDSVMVPINKDLWTIAPGFGITNFSVVEAYQLKCMLGWIQSPLTNNYSPILLTGVLLIPSNPNKYGNIYYWATQN